jgi:ABC-type Na+ efflux pump permease subunit
MKTAKTRKKGFVLVLIIVLLALISIYMIVLTNDANLFIFQADRAYLKACEQNLAASGLNWAKKNVNAIKSATKTVELDAADMSIKNAVLSVKLSAGEKSKYLVEIDTSCRKARQQLDSVKKFTIEIKP